MENIKTLEDKFDFQMIMNKFGVKNETTFSKYLKEIWVVRKKNK